MAEAVVARAAGVSQARGEWAEPLPCSPLVAPAVHFIGIGGQSMSALAAALVDLGARVSGSDATASARTARLAAAGVPVALGHSPRHVAELPAGALVVVTTDVRPDNPELRAARARDLAVVHRSALLEWFLRGGHRPPGSAVTAIAVTGTHGKSTTTALTALALLTAGRDPTAFVAADVPFLGGGNYRLGGGEPVVAEADESDGSFLRYRPDVAVVTNVEPEHLEHYGGDFARVREAYREFLGAVPRHGLAVLCGDDPTLRALDLRGVPVLWYGLGPGVDLGAEAVEVGATSRLVPVCRGRRLPPLAVGVPGVHNVRNALAALGVALHLGVDPAVLGPAFAGYRGIGRRFQVLCQGTVTVVDDYAHHPSEIAATLAAARLLRPQRLVAVFQPHRYQRTQHLWEAFGGAFAAADLVLLDDIYAPAGEEPLPGVGAAALARWIGRGSGVPVRHVPSRDALLAACVAEARAGDLFLVMGAGDVTALAHALAQRLCGPGSPG